MLRTDVAAAVNARVAPAIEYGPDPYGWRMFTRLAAVAQRGLSGHEGLRVIDPVRRFHGPTGPVQSFAGMAALGGRPVHPASSEMNQERAAGVLTDTSMRIFAERLARGR